MAGSKLLKDYLKKYDKKKKKSDSNRAAGGVLIVDEDPVWQKPLIEKEDGNDSAEEEKPQVEKDIEVRQMKRLEQLLLKRPYNAIAEDGSWGVSVEQKPDSDLSPPRKQRTRKDSPSPEPEPRRPRSSAGDTAYLNSDLSPPRKRGPPSPEPRLKPARESSDLSPPRQQWKLYHTPLPELDQKLRKSSGMDSNLSLPRKDRSRNGKGIQRTGLIKGKDIWEENSKRKEEELLRFQELDPSVTGEGVEAVYRDKKSGRRISKEEYLKSKVKPKEKPKEKKLEWGKGLAQKREAEARLLELELEKDKPFARTRDDPELQTMLKGRLRWGDPMAHFVKRKRSELAL